VFREPENRGPGATRNRGISIAQAPLVCTLDSDDLWLPHYLETMASALESNPAAAVAYTDAWVLDAATGRVRKTSAMAYQDPPEAVPADTQTFLVELLQRNFIYNSVAARREALVAVGGYDERPRIGEDWELWLRLAAAGFRFVRVPQWLAVYRKHADSLTSDSERLLAAANEVYRIVIEEWSTSDELRDLALKLRDARELRVRRRAKAAGLLGPLVGLRRTVRQSMLWHREPPQELADLLLTVATTRER
jgi:GT2 family glycosyltransferase